MSETCFLGLDLGTTHVKCIALSPDGRVLGSCARPVQTLAPRPGRAEQDAAQVWGAAAAALAEIAEAVGPQSVEALTLGGAMHTCLPVAADGTPLAPALTWADQRAAGVCRRLREQSGQAGLEGLYRRTGCPLQPIYHIPKLRWYSEQEVAGRAALWVALKDFVLHRLTGSWLADFSIWSATGLLDIHRCRWEPQALELAGISPERLPPLASPFGRAGLLSKTAARATGLPSGLPLVLGASDGALANLGCGTLAPGQVVITVGTSGAVRQWVTEPRLDPAQRTWCYLLAPGRWFAGGAINNAGLAVQWARDSFYTERPAEPAAAGRSAGPGRDADAGYELLFAEAARAPAGAGGARCLPYFAGERSPFFRADARASFVGLGWEHGRGHLARAVLEAVALRLADIWDALGISGLGEPARLTGGILRTPFWAQLCCDVLGVPLTAVEAADASAVGAALLAQAAMQPGLSLQELAGRVHPGQRWLPDPGLRGLYRRMLEESRGLYRRFVDSGPARGYSEQA